jgi:hypothetical protein
MKDDAKQLGASFLSLLLPNPSNVNKVANSINDDVLLPPKKFVRNGLREARSIRFLPSGAAWKLRFPVPPMKIRR